MKKKTTGAIDLKEEWEHWGSDVETVIQNKVSKYQMQPDVCVCVLGGVWSHPEGIPTKKAKTLCVFDNPILVRKNNTDFDQVCCLPLNWRGNLMESDHNWFFRLLICDYKCSARSSRAWSEQGKHSQLSCEPLIWTTSHSTLQLSLMSDERWSGESTDRPTYRHSSDTVVV